ncbi:MAG: hypothetical protein Q8L10_05655 [Candidatus Moranbacteria bacterium]|nr:hypothetical protein [Candidatus Moranbacteria bacterium]
MSLSEIKNKLYKKDPDKDLMFHDESEFDARSKNVELGKIDPSAEDVWRQQAPIPLEKKKNALKIGGIVLGVVVAIVLLLVAVYQIRKASFGEDRVTVAVDGPKETRSGKLLTYEVTYNNDNWASLSGAVLRINHPESFKPEESTVYKTESPTVSLVDLGNLEGHASGKIVFSGRAYSPKGTLMYIKAGLSYQPSNFSSRFLSEGQIGVNVISTPMTLEIMAPQGMASGDALDYQVSYKNVGAEDFENIRIKVDFPEGFIFSKSNPSVSEGNNIWYIGHLSAGDAGKIVISGKLQGERDNIKKVAAYIGTINQGQFVTYNEESTTTKIAASPLAIYQTVNGSTNFSANAGDALRFEIHYKNASDLGLGNVNIKETLNSPVLDYSTLEAEGGAYDTDNRTIEWKAADHPGLANLGPGQEGMIAFSIKVSDVVPLQTVNDKNFVISSVVRIDSPDIPTPIEMNKIVAGNKMDIKLNSKLIVDVKGYYNDPFITNTGPIPPAVGQETTYAIHLKAGNVSNDVTDAKIETVLPTGVVMTGKTYPEGANLEYNGRTNSIVWNIGSMKVGEGIISPLREVAFQVKIKPSLNQVGQMVDILQSGVFSAKDSFTQVDLTAQFKNKNIMLPEDQSIDANGWKVVQ